MNNIPPHIFKQIQEVICRPEGIFSFEYHSKDLFDQNKRGGVIIEIPSGGHLFRIERDDNLFLHFFHSSPGTGTRKASIDLKELPSVEKVFMTFTWTPTEVNFYVSPRVQNGKLYRAKGVTSKKQFRVGKGGSIFQVGDQGVEVMGISVFQGGVQVLQTTALEAWKQTLNAIEILATGESDQGYIYEVVVTNLSLTILVSGFEAYMKKRFMELELEGIKPNTANLIKKFFPKKGQDEGIVDELDRKANEQNKTILQLIDETKTINFQNYQKCKLAYNKAYNIKFGELDLPSDVLERLKKFIQYRHKIIHVSALMGMLNQPEVPPEEPVFPTKELAQEARLIFDQFIEKIHDATLALRPSD